MKKSNLLLAILSILIASFVYYSFFQNEIPKKVGDEFKEKKGRPKIKNPEPAPFDPSKLEEKELIDYTKWRSDIEASGYQFTDYSTKQPNRKVEYFSDLPSYSYANNRVTGSWSQKYVHMTSANGPGYNEGGSDALGSVYDPVNDEMFILSRPGHIYKIDESKSIKWSLRNHKRNFLGSTSLNFRGLVLNGVNLPDNSFRLVFQQPDGGMEFSDDEGRTWTTANGALFQSSLNFKTHVVKTPTGRRVVAHGGNLEGGAGFDKLFISDDYGLNYRESSFKFARSSFEVNTTKPHNDNSIYAFVRRISDSKIFIFKLGADDTDFSLIKQPTQTFPGLDTLHGTLVGGRFYFYVSDGNRNIYYSNDEGETWQHTNTNNDRNIVGVHPTRPNIVFKGFVDLFMSQDFGATFAANRHRLSPTTYVWDLEHLRISDKEGGGSFTFAGMHFGSYYTSDPADWSSWKSVNRGSPNILAYDAITSEVHDRIYTANQDRGSQSFLDTPSVNGYYNADREANTDVFRVAFSKNESSVWFWYWFGTIGRASTTNGGNYGTVTRKDFYDSWWATSMIPSPDETEDAIYIPTGQNRLEKITYTGSTLLRTIHPYTFPGSVVSFNYSSFNKSRWYVGLKTGEFFYSTDGGATFTQTSYSGTMPGQLDRHTKQRQVIVASPKDENVVYYAGRGNNFLISNDGGITFTNHNTGLNVSGIMDFTVDPTGKYIFAACNFSGAWVYSAEEDRWYKMDGDDVPSLTAFTDAQYIKSKDIVRFSTYGSGILDFTINNESLSINDNLLQSLNSIKAFPNPTSDQFEIKISSSKVDVLVHIYSITGKLISNKKHKVKNGKINLSLENENAGIYITKIFLEKPLMIKIVKK
ncbi:T9SS type A sorting domain-containing protein [uncultured Polaribacter sp.]|uniref:T9SS type A sorting domain-containing protein n=1 Tax=uncultured Polaribacter sp. TaxID=174711 RepID=UPI00260F659B|nr:T9SS type A sorting domain-containing protein [uncultured Polaribacter sp.]